MNIGSLTNPIHGLTPSPTTGLQHRSVPGSESRSTDAQPTQEEYAAKQFESVFLSMILKEMRATLSEGLFGKEASDTFGALFDLHMGEHLAERGGLGIREMVASTYRDRAVDPQQDAPASDPKLPAASAGEAPQVDTPVPDQRLKATKI